MSTPEYAATMRILIVDDDATARHMMGELVTYMGHVPLPARDGIEAVRLFQSEGPDIVLMDVMMPALDGYEATAMIRKIPTERWVPVVFLSALERHSNLLRGLEAGGDDYIEKPINLAALQVKIRSLQRVVALQQMLADKRRQLERYLQQADQDARIGSHIMGRLVSMAGLNDEALQYWTRPLQRFSGDLVAAARTPANVLHVMLADAAGHGLPAALNVLPLADIFYAMTADGFSLARLVVAMDKKIKQLFPVDRFVAATLLAVDPHSGEIQVWNGGNPTPLFLGANGHTSGLEKSRRLPLGLLQNHGADARPESMRFEQGGQLVVYSDGMSEARAADGSEFPAEAICRSLGTLAPAARLGHILDRFHRHVGQQHERDDVSLMLIDVTGAAPATSTPAPPAPLRLARPAGAGWKVQFRLSAPEIKVLDVTPFLMTIVESLEPDTTYRRQIFMILAELFNNALEHGLLGLDSRMKASAEGFDAYMRARTGRLGALAQGCIEIALEDVFVADRAALRIQIKDSGSGFDHGALRSSGNADGWQAHGRGISLVESLSLSLEYCGTGNEVICHCLL